MRRSHGLHELVHYGKRVGYLLQDLIYQSSGCQKVSLQPFWAESLHLRDRLSRGRVHQQLETGTLAARLSVLWSYVIEQCLSLEGLQPMKLSQSDESM